MTTLTPALAHVSADRCLLIGISTGIFFKNTTQWLMDALGPHLFLLVRNVLTMKIVFEKPSEIKTFNLNLPRSWERATQSWVMLRRTAATSEACLPRALAGTTWSRCWQSPGPKSCTQTCHASGSLLRPTGRLLRLASLTARSTRHSLGLVSYMSYLVFIYSVWSYVMPGLQDTQLSYKFYKWKCIYSPL